MPLVVVPVPPTVALEPPAFVLAFVPPAVLLPPAALVPPMAFEPPVAVLPATVDPPVPVSSGSLSALQPKAVSANNNAHKRKVARTGCMNPSFSANNSRNLQLSSPW